MTQNLNCKSSNCKSTKIKQQMLLYSVFFVFDKKEQKVCDVARVQCVYSNEFQHPFDFSIKKNKVQTNNRPTDFRLL